MTRNENKEIDEEVEANQSVNEEIKKDKEIDEEVETNQRVAFNLIEIYPEELKQHEVNSVLYGEEDVDLDLVMSIRRKGLLEPLIITDENVIISGHRRWRALLYINEKKYPRLIVDDKNDKTEEATFVKRKAKCQVVHFKNKEEEKLAIVEYNRRRTKRISQLYNEIEMLHEAFDVDAIQIRNSKLKHNNVIPTLVKRLKENEDYYDIVDWNLSPAEIAYEWGHLVGGPMYDMEKEEYDQKKATTNKKIGDILGIGKTNVAKLTEIGRFATTFGDEVAIKAMERMDKGIWKINAAHIVVQMRKTYLSRSKPGSIYCKNLLQEIERGVEIKEKKEKGKILTPAAAKKELDKEVLNIFENKESFYTGPIKLTYSILYFDFPELSTLEPEIEESPEIDELPHEIKKIFVPAAANAALFLVANVENIKHCAIFLKFWGFKLRSYIVIENEQKGYDMLLFSSRGKWPIPVNKDWSTYIIRDKSEIPKNIQSMYPDVESFYEINLKYTDDQPEGWGKSLEDIEAEKIKKERSQRNVNTEDEDDKDMENRSMHPGMAGQW